MTATHYLSALMFCALGASTGISQAAPLLGPSGTARAPLLLAQASPEAAIPSGGTFEEEIVPQRYAGNPAVDAFIQDMVARYDFDPATLHALFNQVSYSATAVKLVMPAPTPTTRNWQTYQSRFVEPIRINAGVRFWRNNLAALQRASNQFGVPPEVIVGIIGIETLYGRYMGNFRTLDALTTLTFDYPDTPNRAERQATFRKNLEDLLVWTHESGIDPTTVLGSYTGAIGIAQFLPSSIVSYAVDFDGNHSIDLRNSTADAIGSVANYLHQYGWETGRPVVWQIAPDAGSQGIAQAAADGQPEPHWQLEQLLRAGLLMNQPGLNPSNEAGTPVLVIDLPTPGQTTQYQIGLKNFYVLTRYNRSFFYAMAVYQLGQQVKQRLQATGELDANGMPTALMAAPSGPTANGSTGNGLTPATPTVTATPAPTGAGNSPNTILTPRPGAAAPS